MINNTMFVPPYPMPYGGCPHCPPRCPCCGRPYGTFWQGPMWQDVAGGRDEGLLTQQAQDAELEKIEPLVPADTTK